MRVWECRSFCIAKINWIDFILSITCSHVLLPYSKLPQIRAKTSSRWNCILNLEIDATFAIKTIMQRWGNFYQLLVSERIILVYWISLQTIILVFNSFILFQSEFFVIAPRPSYFDRTYLQIAILAESNDLHIVTIK